MLEKQYGLKVLGGKVKKGDHEIVRKIKQSDFKTFADYLFSKGYIVTPTYDESLIKKSNVIDIININAMDISKSIDYINEERENANIIDNNLNYEIFTQEEFEDFFEEIANKITNFINNINLEKQ